jgi:hypothetical protein
MFNFNGDYSRPCTESEHELIDVAWVAVFLAAVWSIRSVGTFVSWIPVSYLLMINSRLTLGLPRLHDDPQKEYCILDIMDVLSSAGGLFFVVLYPKLQNVFTPPRPPPSIVYAHRLEFPNKKTSMIDKGIGTVYVRWRPDSGGWTIPVPYSIANDGTDNTFIVELVDMYYKREATEIEWSATSECGPFQCISQNPYIPPYLVVSVMPNVTGESQFNTRV